MYNAYPNPPERFLLFIANTNVTDFKFDYKQHVFIPISQDKGTKKFR